MISSVVFFQKYFEKNKFEKKKIKKTENVEKTIVRILKKIEKN